MEPTLHHLAVPGPLATHGEPRRIAWWEWGPTGAPDAPAQVVVCVHGLTRQARDFDVLAQALLQRAAVQVVCVDVAGRGHSDWLADPSAYAVPTYAADLALLLAHLRARHAAATGSAEPTELFIDWVGTSMGGLIGMALAAQPGLGLRRLVLNDVGPVIEAAALRRIATYVGNQAVYASEQEAVQALAQLHRGFGPHSPEQWLALSRPMLRPVQGGWMLHYDPAIAQPLRAMQAAGQAAGQAVGADPGAAIHAGEALLWQMYEAITAEVLLLRGAESDLLSHATALAMTQRGPRARLLEFAGVGHAPTLVAPEQVAQVCDFLLAP
ncbi:predicted hydrolase or acyltransferase, alpha/beta hydrolase superfamily [Serpentinimonas raichei]|uniref:Predicted hydrolase or acyltransferase, alpha/beta hydrolase superfamily n=1 Tax=Serpentinimonas raichei TaxID=1458425 RepID=A0A060NFV9_9BURK|nr:alpha/beta hydrolase [Serpentinimonas raichei]BAO80401.1 predicted hydrolase or acyltransferase, alpha/beta hydrolase superfamily [Serpentinimonas raichei]